MDMMEMTNMLELVNMVYYFHMEDMEDMTDMMQSVGMSMLGIKNMFEQLAQDFLHEDGGRLAAVSPALPLHSGSDPHLHGHPQE